MYDHLSELAQRLGRHMAENSPTGLRTHFGDELLEAFPNENRKTLGGALAELEADGLVTLSRVLGPHLPRVRTTVELFVASDAAITGHDPVDDSVVLARLLLEKPELGGNARPPRRGKCLARARGRDRKAGTGVSPVGDLRPRPQPDREAARGTHPAHRQAGPSVQSHPRG